MKKQSKIKVAIVAARFNEHITKKLVKGAESEFIKFGVKKENINIVWVPGSWEIPLAVKRAIKIKRYDGIVCVGVIIKGETEHDRHIADSCVREISKMMVKYEIPIGNCILACKTEGDALQRAGGKEGNRGCQAAHAVFSMLSSPLMGEVRRG